jgi:hypothetical protein
VLGHLDPLALLLGTLVTPLALPIFSGVIEEGVLGNLNLLAPVSDALESSVAFPLVSVGDEGMLREVL